jgi:hypothetical protein
MSNPTGTQDAWKKMIHICQIQRFLSNRDVLKAVEAFAFLVAVESFPA